jgi:hypothetical protein
VVFVSGDRKAIRHCENDLLRETLQACPTTALFQNERTDPIAAAPLYLMENHYVKICRRKTTEVELSDFYSVRRAELTKIPLYTAAAQSVPITGLGNIYFKKWQFVAFSG